MLLTALFAFTAFNLASLALAEDPAYTTPYKHYSQVFDNIAETLNDGQWGYGLKDLPKTAYTKKQWDWGKLPRVCFETAQVHNLYCDPHEVEVYEITYEDCDNPKIFCRCVYAEASIDEVAERVGQIPVKARQYVGVFSIYSSNKDAAAWASGPEVAIFGRVEHMSIYIHEIAHHLDLYAVGGKDWFADYFPYSGLSAWRNKVAKDSCVPDEYSKKSYAEDYANALVMAAYHGMIGDIFNLQTGQRPQGCMLEQLNTAIHHTIVERQLLTYDPSARCDIHWKEFAVVCQGYLARETGRCEGLPDYDAKVAEQDPEWFQTRASFIDARKQDQFSASSSRRISSSMSKEQLESEKSMVDSANKKAGYPAQRSRGAHGRFFTA
ncbi:hypothetical protein BJ508DRAFT_334579 [Ascobolus immersus RN42]|uniref:Conidiation-specific protein 13 n=1 Tax=Ascobolus immersus RN42 TaxID=1160509 RepID=A0A3N4HJZ5_ASCIM|nr:hypothetical protein BJ508DRAFT_334579 [Ascobolus immersus RN42]